MIDVDVVVICTLPLVYPKTLIREKSALVPPLYILFAVHIIPVVLYDIDPAIPPVGVVLLDAKLDHAILSITSAHSSKLNFTQQDIVK